MSKTDPPIEIVCSVFILDATTAACFSSADVSLKIKLKRGEHPTLDDGFFNLAAFNAEIKAAESRSSSRGRLSQDDDDEDGDDPNEEVDYFASVDAPEALDEEDLEGGSGMCSFLVKSRHGSAGLHPHRTVL